MHSQWGNSLWVQNANASVKHLFICRRNSNNLTVAHLTTLEPELKCIIHIRCCLSEKYISKCIFLFLVKISSYASELRVGTPSNLVSVIHRNMNVKDFMQKGGFWRHCNTACFNECLISICIYLLLKAFLFKERK